MRGGGSADVGGGVPGALEGEGVGGGATDAAVAWDSQQLGRPSSAAWEDERAAAAAVVRAVEQRLKARAREVMRAVRTR